MAEQAPGTGPPSAALHGSQAALQKVKRGDLRAVLTRPEPGKACLPRSQAPGQPLLTSTISKGAV